jgi:hypothetical protein
MARSKQCSGCRIVQTQHKRSSRSFRASCLRERAPWRDREERCALGAGAGCDAGWGVRGFLGIFTTPPRRPKALCGSPRVWRPPGREQRRAAGALDRDRRGRGRWRHCSSRTRKSP